MKKYNKKVPFSPIHINEIRIIGLLRDFYKSKAKRDWKYPQHDIQIRSFTIWGDEEIEGEIRKRANERDFAKANPLKDVTPCSKDETWATDDKWALMKKDRKKAVKLFDNMVNLTQYSKDKELGELEKDGNSPISTNFIFSKGHYPEFRPGERKRCEDYCSVSHACPHYKEFKENKK